MSHSGLVVCGIIAAIIGLSAGFNAGARISERVVHAAVSAAASEIRGSTYAPIVAAAITGGTAMLCAILLPVVTLVTLNRLNRKESYADQLVAYPSPPDRLGADRSAHRVIDHPPHRALAADASGLAANRPLARLKEHARR